MFGLMFKRTADERARQWLRHYRDLADDNLTLRVALNEVAFKGLRKRTMREVAKKALVDTSEARNERG